MPGRRVEVALRWGDLDAYGHVNNVEMVRVLEEARTRAFWVDGPLPPLSYSEPLWALVAAIEVRYHRPVNYRVEPVDVLLTIRNIGGASFVIDYIVRQSIDAPVCVTASCTVALVDAVGGTPVRLDPYLRRSLGRFAAD